MNSRYCQLEIERYCINYRKYILSPKGRKKLFGSIFVTFGHFPDMFGKAKIVILKKNSVSYMNYGRHCCVPGPLCPLDSSR